MSDANTHTALAILGAVAFVIAMFIGAITAPMVPRTLTALAAEVRADDVRATVTLGLILAVPVIALMKIRKRWAQIVLAVAVGLLLGSLAPPVMVGAG